MTAKPRLAFHVSRQFDETGEETGVDLHHGKDCNNALWLCCAKSCTLAKGDSETSRSI